MLKNNLKVFCLMLLCVFTMACSFEIKDTGDVSFNLPSRQAGSLDEIKYFIEVIKDGNLICSEKDVQKKVTLYKLPEGLCTIKISGKDKAYEYFGEKDVKVIGGQTVSCQIILSKKQIETQPEKPDIPPIEGDKLKEIELSLASGAYIEYGKPLVLSKNNIIITETYEKAGKQPQEKTDYANYIVTPDKGTAVGPMNVTVKHKTAGIEKTVEIPCKYNIEKPTVILESSGSLTVAQGANGPTVTAKVGTFKDTELAKNYVITYQWQKDNIDIEGANSAEYTVSTTVIGSFTYNCKITVKPNDLTAAYCLNADGVSNVAESGVLVTVNEAVQPPADAIKDWNTLEQKIQTAKNGDVIIVADMDVPYKTISLKQNEGFTLTSGESITIKGVGASSTLTRSEAGGSFFSIGTDATINFENIVMDNQKDKFTLKNPILNITKGNVNIKNCTLQNGESQNGGAINISAGQSYVTVGITGTTIQNCTSTSTGGGIYINGNAVGNATVTIDGNSVIKNNTSAKAKEGGGLYLNKGTLTIKDTKFVNNKKDTSLNNYVINKGAKFNTLDAVQNVITQTQNVQFDSSGKESVIQ